tara:strand:- start:279 stop:800 length:522 start_codon:yes stop_codon:yes gene_type:complete
MFNQQQFILSQPTIQQISPEMQKIQKEHQKFLQKQLKEKQDFDKKQNKKMLKLQTKDKIKLTPPDKLTPAKTVLNIPNKITTSFEQPKNYNSDKITLKDLYLNPYYRNLNNSKIYRDSEFNYIKFDSSKGFTPVNETDVDKKYKTQDNQQVFLDPTYGLIKYNENLKSFEKVK